MMPWSLIQKANWVTISLTDGQRNQYTDGRMDEIPISDTDIFCLEMHLGFMLK